MSTRPEPQPSEAPVGVCPLCGAGLAAGAPRCRACGLYQSSGSGRTSPFTGVGLWLLAGFLVAVYAVTLVIVALAR